MRVHWSLDLLIRWNAKLNNDLTVSREPKSACAVKGDLSEYPWHIDSQPQWTLEGLDEVQKISQVFVFGMVICDQFPDFQKVLRINIYDNISLENWVVYLGHISSTFLSFFGVYFKVTANRWDIVSCYALYNIRMQTIIHRLIQKYFTYLSVSTVTMIDVIKPTKSIFKKITILAIY